MPSPTMPVSVNGGERKKTCQEEYEEDDEEEVPVPRNPSPPDGGWGWWVVLASFLCNMIVDGVCFSFGVVTKEYQRVFKATHSEVGWVGSSLAGCYLLVGPFVSAMCARYGCRKVTMMGSVVTMIGFALSTQSSSLKMLICTYGIIGGIGFGMIYLPSIVCVGHWFEKKRAFTTGIVVCGTGMGQSVFPPLAHYLLMEYDWEGQNLIMAGIVLHCAVCGMAFLPIERYLFKQQRNMRRIVEIERGAIMKALIEHKKRERTISNGSLDNCVITRDNRLIKLDPKLFEIKRNSSFIARFKRQLGFSTQSLECSKSIQGIPSIVLDAVQKDLNRTSVSSVYIPNGTKVPENLSQSQVVQKRGSVSEGYILTSSTNIPNGTVSIANGSILLNGITKAQNCDVIPNEDNLNDEGITFKAKQQLSTSRSASDLESVSVPSSSIDGSMISIHLIEGGTPDSINSIRSVRHRSSNSVSSSYSSQMMYSNAPSQTYRSSNLSVPQMHASVEELDYGLNRHNSLFWKCWQILCDMFDVRLMMNPVFALLVVSSFVTLLAFYVPFFYLPSKGESVGMTEQSAAFLLSIVGVTNTVGRILCGWLADRPWMSTLHFNNIALIIAGLAILLCPICTSEGPLAILAALFGLCAAVYVSLRSVLLVDLLGLEMLTKSFGLLILFQGMAAFIGAPIAGGLRDATGDVNNCFYLAGGLTILSGLLMLPIVYLRKVESNKDMSEVMPSTVLPLETLKLEHIESRI